MNSEQKKADFTAEVVKCFAEALENNDAIGAMLEILDDGYENNQEDNGGGCLCKQNFPARITLTKENGKYAVAVRIQAKAISTVEGTSSRNFEPEQQELGL